MTLRTLMNATRFFAISASLVFASGVRSATGDTAEFGGYLVFGGDQRQAATLVAGTAPNNAPSTLLGKHVGEISLIVNVDPKSAQAEIIRLKGHDTLMQLFPGDDGKGFILLTPEAELALAKDIPHAGRYTQFQLRRERVAAPITSGAGSEQWVVYINGQRADALPPGGSIPIDDEVLDFSLGTLGGDKQTDSGFAGVIDRLAVRTPQRLLYVHTLAGGRSGFPPLVKRALPQPGAYIAVGGYKAQQRATLPGIDQAHHGVFEKTTYYALSPGQSVVGRSAPVVVAADWGASLVLRPDLSAADRYVPEDPALAWAGSVSFDDQDGVRQGRRARFSAQGAVGKANAFLGNGVRYEIAPSQPILSDAAKSVFDAGTNVPNFYFSVMACYDVRNMDLVNLQKRGCAERPIFAFPATNATRDQGVLKNVPFGWSYIPFNTLSARSQSSLITSAEELSNAYSGGRSHGFQVAAFGAEYSHTNNQSAEREYKTLREQGRTLKLEQSFRTESHLVLIPDEVALDNCFIQNVMRAAATVLAKGRPLDKIPVNELPVPPAYFDADAADAQCRDGEIDDPLTPAALVALYGTHYAHATTYGARSITKTTIDKDVLRTVVNQAQSSTTKDGYKLDLSKVPGLKLPAATVSIDDQTETGGKAGKDRSGSSENVTIEVVCFGAQSGCSSNEVTIGSEPAPVYLDLRRFDQLLAAPFFTDNRVLDGLRPLVRNEIDLIIAADPPAAIPPVMRIIDVAVTGKSCHYTKEAYDSKGKIQLAYQPLFEACDKLPAVLGVFARTREGTSRSLTFETPQLDGKPWNYNRDLLVEKIDRSWLLTPPLMPCPLSKSECADRQSRLIVEPDISGDGARSLVFKALPEPLLADYPVKLDADCASDCAIRYEAMAEIDERGRENRWVAWSLAAAGGLDRRLVPSPLTYDVTQTVPPVLRGRMLTQRRAGDNAEQLGIDFELTLKDADLPGVLGFAATLDEADRIGPRNIEDVAPSFPIRLINRGGYLVDFRVQYMTRVRQSADGSMVPLQQTSSSGVIPLGKEYAMQLPAGTTDIRVSAMVVGKPGASRDEPALQETIPLLAGPLCRSTEGTVFSPQWKPC